MKMFPLYRSQTTNLSPQKANWRGLLLNARFSYLQTCSEDLQECLRLPAEQTHQCSNMKMRNNLQMVHGKHDMGKSVCFLGDWKQNIITIYMYVSHCVAFLGKTLTVQYMYLSPPRCINCSLSFKSHVAFFSTYMYVANMLVCR